MRTIDIIMGVIFFTLWNLRILARHKPHVKLSATFDTHLGFNVVGNLGSIHEWHIQCLGYMARSYDISSVGIYERITVDEFLAIILFVTKFLIVIILQILRIIAAANHTVQKHRDAPLLAGFVYILGEMRIKGTARFGITIREMLLIIMTKLDKNIIAWLHLIKNFLPSTLIQEALGASAVYRMVVNDNLVVEATLQHHTPTTFRTSLIPLLFGSSRVTNNENSSFPGTGSHHQNQDKYRQKSYYSFHCFI